VKEKNRERKVRASSTLSRGETKESDDGIALAPVWLPAGLDDDDEGTDSRSRFLAGERWSERAGGERGPSGAASKVEDFHPKDCQHARMAVFSSGAIAMRISVSAVDVAERSKSVLASLSPRRQRSASRVVNAIFCRKYELSPYEKSVKIVGHTGERETRAAVAHFSAAVAAETSSPLDEKKGIPRESTFGEKGRHAGNPGGIFALQFAATALGPLSRCLLFRVRRKRVLAAKIFIGPATPGDDTFSILLQRLTSEPPSLLVSLCTFSFLRRRASTAR